MFQQPGGLVLVDEIDEDIRAVPIQPGRFAQRPVETDFAAVIRCGEFSFLQ